MKFMQLKWFSGPLKYACVIQSACLCCIYLSLQSRRRAGVIKIHPLVSEKLDTN